MKAASWALLILGLLLFNVAVVKLFTSSPPPSTDAPAEVQAEGNDQGLAPEPEATTTTTTSAWATPAEVIVPEDLADHTDPNHHDQNNHSHIAHEESDR